MNVSMGGRSVTVDTEGPLAEWWTRFADGRWEPETLHALDTLVTPGAYVVDIGGWVGPVALYAASLGANVHTYEPDPKARAGLERNLALNPELAERITVHPYALGAKAGSAPLSFDTPGNSASTLRRKAQGDSVTVEVRRFADEAQEEFFRKAALIKVDVEGTEYPLLPGIANALKASDAVLILSAHISHIQGMLPPRLPRPVRIAVRGVMALGCYASIMWHLRHGRHWYVADGPGWKAVSRLSFARAALGWIRPQSGEVIIAPRELAL